jgi:hypothetical protein
MRGIMCGRESWLASSSLAGTYLEGLSSDTRPVKTRQVADWATPSRILFCQSPKDPKRARKPNILDVPKHSSGRTIQRES